VKVTFVRGLRTLTFRIVCKVDKVLECKSTVRCVEAAACQRSVSIIYTPFQVGTATGYGTLQAALY
jgi:hypothetical protein